MKVKKTVVEFPTPCVYANIRAIFLFNWREFKRSCHWCLQSFVYSYNYYSTHNSKKQTFRNRDTNMLSDSNQNLSEFCLSACHSYFDVASCKEFSSTIYDTSTFVNEFHYSDEQQGFVPVRKVSFEEDRQNKLEQQQDQGSCSSTKSPILECGGDEDDDHDDDILNFRVTRQETMARKEIFRAGQKRPLPQERGYSELCKLYRCTAWSIDSAGSADVVETTPSHYSFVGATTVRLVHWENALTDSCCELKRRFVVENS
jgi:hypothetical protein